MIRQPPAAVPAAMTSAQETLIHRGMIWFLPPSAVAINCIHDGACWKMPCLVEATSARQMTPMVFCASLLPCAQPMYPADTNCSLPNTPLTLRGFMRPAMPYSNVIRIKPTISPRMGELTIGMTTLYNNPPHACSGSPGFGCDQISAVHTLRPASAGDPRAAPSGAPHNPPINACEELDGRPNHQVTRFQMVAPTSAHTITAVVTWIVLTRPVAIGFATAVP